MTRARNTPGFAIVVAFLIWPIAASAQVPTAAMAPARVSGATRAGSVVVEVGGADAVDMPAAGATVFVADPDLADAQAPDGKHLVILGRAPGQTTVFIFSPGGAVTSYAVTVRRPQDAVAEALRTQVPGAVVDVFRGPAGMTVSGRVSSPAQAATLKAAAQQYLADKEVLNFAVVVEEAVQVNLQVRVAQVSRTVTNNLAFNWDAIFNNGTVAVGLLTGRVASTGLGQFVRDSSSNLLNSVGIGYQSGSVNLATVIDALQSNGLVTILAEPNLTALSGVTASFLVGGEFPVPVAQALNQITIYWKKYGVSIDFTPTVIDGNRISIRVRPEVSELTTVGSVVINSIQIPSLSVSRADTTVELASGQSFAIAGMFQNNMNKTIQQFPGLGNLPILGTMFRSSSFQRNESELVIIVTPYIVRPVDHPSDIHLPTEAITYSSDLEQILLGATGAPDGSSTAKSGSPRLAGPAGFMLEQQP